MAKYLIWTNGPSFSFDTLASALVNNATGEAVQAPPKEHMPPSRPSGAMLRIMLGTKCNYNCVYCSQGADKEDGLHSTLSDIDDFVENIKPFLPTIGRVEFWGGEPLVYIKFLRKLVPKMRKLLPNALFTMVSNGSLFNDEIGAFLEKYAIGYTMSHDTYGHEDTRGVDPLKNPKILESIKRWFPRISAAVVEQQGISEGDACGVSTVLSAKCYDVLKIQEWVNSAFGQYTSVYVGPMLAVGSGSGADLKFTTTQLKELCINGFLGGMLAPINAPYIIHEYVCGFIGNVRNKANPYDKSAMCGVTTGNMIVVDLRGNLYKCQNYVTEGAHHGNLFEEGWTAPEFNSFVNNPACKSCPVVALCRGGCPFITGNDFAETCEIRYWWNLGIFAAAFTRLTGYIPTRIEGEIVRPVKELIQTKHGKFETVDAVDIPMNDELIALFHQLAEQ